jgi:NitT/TauT family transport system ATP-binding protein
LTAVDGPVAVEVRAISHAFQSRGGPVQALADCSLSIPQGCFACVVGPSGCGKSTLLDMVAQMVEPQHGTVTLRSSGGGKPRLAMVFQKPALFPWRSVLGNVTIGLQAKGLSPRVAQQKATSVLDTVGLGAFAKAYPHELSGGMAQRVGIARALALEPDILLMDEPFAAVDAQTRIILQRELLALAARIRMTILFVTHDVAEAVFLADRLVVMSGRPGYVGATAGIGYLITNAQSGLETDKVMAGMIVIGVIGSACAAVLSFLHRRFASYEGINGW